jgi:hypothetical protein
MNRLWMSGAAAVMAMSIAGVNAQTPQTQPPQSQPQTQYPTQQPSTAAQSTATTTVTGCVYKEADIPGRSPNVAERAGVMEDYILVASHDAASTSGTAGTSGTTPPAGTAGTTGMASAPTKAFKLEKIADERLRAVVGKRVEVTGRVDAEKGDKTAATAGAPARDKNLGPDQIELPEFEVTDIKEVEGTCPATPMIKK